MKKNYDWNAIKTEFVTGDISCASLAKKHGISPQTLYRHSQIEHWIDAKREYGEKISEKCAESAAYVASVKLLKELDIADKLSDVLDNAVSDRDQFYRYITKDKSDGTEQLNEQVLKKLDIQAFQNAIKALKSLEEIKCAMYGIVSPEKENTDNEDTERGGVVVLPEIEDEE